MFSLIPLNCLKVPKSSDCRSCPPSSSRPYCDNIDGKSGYDSFQQLPPSMMNSVKGSEVSYQVSVAVTAMQKLVNFTARQVGFISMSYWFSPVID